MRASHHFAGAVFALALCTVTPAIVHADEDATPAAPESSFVTREQLEKALDGMNEQVQAMQTDVDKFKRLKFSGYIQARWETSENSRDSVKVSGNPYTVTSPNLNRFYIRRGRFKLTYDSSPLSQAVIYFDGGSDRTLRLLEAYVTLLDPWTPLHDHQLTIGQQNVPFGFEIERSSSVRELPERSKAENVLFSGERDRGVKLVDQWNTHLQTTLGLFNGGGINQTDFPNTDPTRGKDFLARARWSQGWFDAAASYYFGRNTTPLTGPDVETKKTRIGLDAQTFYELPSLGGGTLRGEVYFAHEVNPDSVKALINGGSAANPVRLLKPNVDPAHLATDARGYYAMWVQNVGDQFQGVVRYDAWDPNTDKDHDQFRRASLGVNYFYDGYTRITLTYDVIKTDALVSPGRYADPADNLWTLQVQHKW